MTGPPRTRDEVLQSVDAIATLIREEAQPSESAQRATERLIEALHGQRLFRLWIPASLDGDELDLIDSLEVIEMVSRIDGSAGWTVMIGIGGNIFAAYMDRSAAEEIFLPARALIAGSGEPRGRAAIDNGGYRAQGAWSYASGAHQATWFTANCVVERDGKVIADDAGQPLIRAMAFPAAAVRIVDNWSVLGMRGTGSHDFHVDPTFIPGSHTFSVFTDAPREPGPLYRFPFASLAQASFAAVALGIGIHALDEFDALATRKTIYGSTQLLADNAYVAGVATDARVTLQSAKALFYQVAEAAWQAVCRGNTPGSDALEDVRLASVHASRSAARAADLVFELSRTSVVRDGDPLGRAWRDVHVVRQHAALSPLPVPAGQ